MTLTTIVSLSRLYPISQWTWWMTRCKAVESAYHSWSTQILRQKFSPKCECPRRWCENQSLTTKVSPLRRLQKLSQPCRIVWCRHCQTVWRIGSSRRRTHRESLSWQDKKNKKSAWWTCSKCKTSVRWSTTLSRDTVRRTYRGWLESS